MSSKILGHIIFCLCHPSVSLHLACLPFMDDTSGEIFSKLHRIENITTVSGFHRQTPGFPPNCTWLISTNPICAHPWNIPGMFPFASTWYLRMSEYYYSTCNAFCKNELVELCPFFTEMILFWWILKIHFCNIDSVNKFFIIRLFSSPEHKVLKVSYCEHSLSVVRPFTLTKTTSPPKPLGQ